MWILNYESFDLFHSQALKGGGLPFNPPSDILCPVISFNSGSYTYILNDDISIFQNFKKRNSMDKFYLFCKIKFVVEKFGRC